MNVSLRTPGRGVIQTRRAADDRRQAAPLVPLVAIVIVLALAACLLVSTALILLVHPSGIIVPATSDQNQKAKTAAYLISFAVILPLSLWLVPRVVDGIAARSPGRRLDSLAAGLVSALAAALVLVRLAPHIGVHDGLKALLLVLCLWWVAAAWAIRRASHGESLGPLERVATPALAAALVLALILCLTDLSGLNLLALGLGALALLAAWALRARLAAIRLSAPAGHAVDVLFVVLLLFAVPNVVVYHSAGLPNAFYPPGIIAFHQNWLLGPANQLLGGGALLVNVPVSQYGVGFIYFLAGWFHLAPIGYGTYGLLDGLVTAVFYICAYALLRVVGVRRWLAVTALSLAVVVFLYHLYFSVGQLPQQGPLRFGLPLAVIVAEAAALRWPPRRHWLRAVSLLVVGAGAIWSLEMFIYTSLTYVGVVAYEAWLRPENRRRSLLRGVGLGVAACVAAHLILVVWTVIATGHLPDWGQYLTYVDALVLGKVKAGQISYGFAPWSPGLALGGASLASLIAVVLVLWRAPARARREPVRFLALVGLSVYAAVLFSYTDNRSSTYLLPYVGLPLLLVIVLWLGLLSPARGGALAYLTAGAVGCVMLAAAWPTVSTLFSQSALAHAYPGGGLRAAIHRLWHAPPIDPRAPQGVRLLDTYAPEKRVFVLLPDLPDLGTEILMRGHRANALFMGDPKADGFIDSTAWTGKLTAQLARVRAGTQILTNRTGLRVAAALRGRSASIPLEHPLGGFNPQIEWILQRLADRFSLKPVASEPDGLVVASLSARS